jgi:hypothetical protein
MPSTAAAPVEPQRPAAKPVPPPPPATARERPEARTVRMQISAKPASARMTLDGSAIPNPFEADVIKGGKHRLKAQADGHRSVDMTLSFDRDRDLDLELERIAAERPRPRAKARAKARAQQARAEEPGRAKAPAAPETSATRGAGFVSESPY